MKTPFLTSLTVVVLLGMTAVLNARADASGVPIFNYAASPDHPSTWVDGATRAHTDLRWNAEKNMLVADVTYSTADWADSVHPARQDQFTLTLPTVRLDKATGEFTAHGVTVASLQPGFFGHHVVLARDVALSIHRHHGVLYGALVPARSE
jgi:hypothetical protein